ncbi:hypothetical protein LTR09_004126 [Extremus antarcticus]|uniref:Serine aminopeptidase S33 domain-containing protein n=1 Tax=Extremus antarcticus TaxID=702011 RepID=A0AAJ0DQJ0_9PEZI|nr:hypothetical protein LTR09_004126 [Extremus antarcticus]
MFVPEVAEALQTANINALVYDSRNLGESDGQPRHDIDPAKQVCDYSDALTFLLTQPTVNAAAISFWGMSFSGTIALRAASLDKRARSCIAACPYLDLKPPPEKAAKVLAKCMKDRESRGVGNPPTYLPMLTAAGTNPAGLHLQLDAEELRLVETAKRRVENFDTKSTVETYYKFFTWGPEEIIKYISPTPVLLIVPEKDTWSLPEKQYAMFETLQTPKQLHTVQGKGHLTLFTGDGFPDMMNMQAEFLRTGPEGRRA